MILLYSLYMGYQKEDMLYFLLGLARSLSCESIKGYFTGGTVLLYQKNSENHGGVKFLK